MNYHPTPRTVYPIDGVPPIEAGLDAYLQSDGHYYRARKDESNQPYFEIWENNTWSEIWTTSGDTYLDFLTCLQNDNIKSAIKKTKRIVYTLILMLTISISFLVFCVI